MIVLDVFLNGNRVCRASVGDQGTVLADTWVRGRDIADPHQVERLRLDVGGTSSLHDGYRSWVGEDLAVGDRITIQVLEVDDAEVLRAPSTADPADENAA